ncbi:MAG: MBL fold metallo-hydrolase [Chlorobiaceae bacterium]|nr:MBL fold metallo-hydrolase [Chlorobiaceae bacterium]
MELQFYGATQRVTGSCHILRAAGRTLLLDCGLIQGKKEEEALNRSSFPFDPSSLDAVVLSHGHIDHSGRLPLLVKHGFRGPVYTQQATIDLCRVLLLDSASLAESDAAYRRKQPETRKDLHAEPLYTREDALRALETLSGMPYHVKKEILPGISVRFQDAGHILGSACVEVWIEEGGVTRKLVFSGDLGQYGSPILKDPDAIDEADAVIVESTYGDRLHRELPETLAEIGGIIGSACDRCGNILIPAFAIGRSQELLYLFAQNFDAWNLERWQVFLDSPMAIEASRIYWDYPELYDEEALLFRNGHKGMPLLKNLHMTSRADQSQAINSIRTGAIIIAGSGMCNGGRVLHHLKHNISRPECSVIITGYQAEGTLGRQLVEGAEQVTIHGTSLPVRATLHTIGGLSAHGDQDDLLRWLGGFRSNPSVYVVHGDEEVKKIFRQKIMDKLGLAASIPQAGEIIDLASLKK